MTRKRILFVLKWALYSVIFLIAMLLQTVVFGRGLFGCAVCCVPVAVGCVAVREGAERGGFFALCAGLFWCLSGANYGSLQIITLTVIGLLCGTTCERVLTRRFWPSVALSLGAICLNEGVGFLVRLYLGVATGAQALTVLLPSIGVSLLTAPLFVLLTWLAGRVEA